MEKRIEWPGWETVRVIGRGSFGTVYEIKRDVFGKTEYAALKVISIPETEEELEELYNEGYDEASVSTHYKGYLEEIVREYSLMLDLKGASNVVYCDDLSYKPHADGIGWDIFIKMELLTPLKKAASKAYDEKQVIKLGIDMCKALEVCKDKKIIHRDIKPENIFVSDTGDYKLGDFGVAKVEEKTVTGTKIGTFEYMAPEVYNNKPYGIASDIYSLGLVMYWLMNDKRTPFLPDAAAIPSASEKEEARNRRFRGEAIPAPKYGSSELQRVVLKACAFNTNDRFSTPKELHKALEECLNPQVKKEKAPPKKEEKKEVKQEKNPDAKVDLKISAEEARAGCKKRITLPETGKILYVTVPAGCPDGNVICLVGKGYQKMPAASPGDVYVRVLIDSEAKTTPKTSKKTEAVVALTKSECGTGVVKTVQIDGKKVGINIPAGSRFGETKNVNRVDGEGKVRIHICALKYDYKMFAKGCKDYPEELLRMYAQKTASADYIISTIILVIAMIFVGAVMPNPLLFGVIGIIYIINMANTGMQIKKNKQLAKEELKRRGLDK